MKTLTKNNRPATITLAEKILKSLYKQPGETSVTFTQNQLKVKRMYEDCFAKWLNNPDLEDKQMVSYLKNGTDTQLFVS